MLNEKMGKFRHGASEFMSYWLPMILFTAANELKEEAEKIAKQELDAILASVS
jgi:hypothetical protein